MCCSRKNCSIKNAALVTWAAFMIFTSTPLAAFSASAKVVPPAELWYAIYLANTPVGGSHMTTANDNFEGRSAKLSKSETATTFNLLGNQVSQEVTSSDWADALTDKPIYEEVVIGSGGHTTTITARFTSHDVTAVLDSGGRKETRILAIPPGTILMADDPTMSPPTAKGKRIVYFDPATIALEDVTVAKAKDANVSNRVVVTTATGSVTVDQGEDGAPDRIEMPGGLLMVRENGTLVAGYMHPASIPNTDGMSNRTFSSSGEEAPPDLAVVTSVAPIGQPLLPVPSHLILEVIRPGQKAEKFDIQSILPPSDATETVSMARANRDLLPYLADSPYLGLDSVSLRQQAQSIVNGETNLYDIAVQLKRWVHQSMSPSASLGLPRSASDILGDRRGVCRDYALLYTALARSTGLPTRLCAGLVGYHGRFYYHAWAESFIGGKTGWMPFDPTLPREPVDASHIPLVKGDPASLYDLVGQIGNLKINIIRCDP